MSTGHVARSRLDRSADGAVDPRESKEGPRIADTSHNQTVERIAAELRDAAARGQKVHFVKSSVHHVVPVPGDARFAFRPVDISGLDRVLEVDLDRQTCVCEPGVTFRELLRHTLPHGLIPAVVPELEGITVGGAVAGCSVESMSYKLGGFHDNCLEYELITGDGRVVTCSPKRDPHIFHQIHGSYGTLALLARLTFSLYPAKRFVTVEYHHHRTFKAFEQAMHHHCEARDFDLVDGIIHGPNQLTLCLGNFVDSVPYASDYTRENIYYKSTAELDVDHLTTEDYCFRYDAECHWLTRTVPPLQWRWLRKLAGRHLIGSTNLIRWSNRLAPLFSRLQKRPDVVCDVFIPAGNFAEFFRWYDEDFQFYPLWIVPYRLDGVYPWVAEEHGKRLWRDLPRPGAPRDGSHTDGLIIDCAVYGRPNSEPGVDYSELLEKKTYELNGVKTLISRNHHTEEQFWQAFNRPNVTHIKAELDPNQVFPELFETFGRVE